MRQSKLIYLSFTVGLLMTEGCGHYPAPIGSARSIWWVSSSEYEVTVWRLPLKDWPKLQKFKSLEHFFIAKAMAPEITDQHIEALSKLNLPKLRDISLAY